MLLLSGGRHVELHMHFAALFTRVEHARGVRQLLLVVIMMMIGRELKVTVEALCPCVHDVVRNDSCAVVALGLRAWTFSFG